MFRRLKPHVFISEQLDNTVEFRLTETTENKNTRETRQSVAVQREGSSLLAIRYYILI